MLRKKIGKCSSILILLKAFFGFMISWSLLIVTQDWNWRWDMTQTRVGLLSKGSREILKQLREPVTLSFYFSWGAKHVPQPYKDYARRIRDLLVSYRLAGEPWIQIRIVDAEPESSQEELLYLVGVEPRFLPNEQRYFYLGLVVHAGDREVTFPSLELNQESSLEYLISRAIVKVTCPQRQRIGVLSSLPVFGAIQGNTLFYGRTSLNPWMVIQELQQQYDVVRLDPDLLEWPADLRCLILIHPQQLPESTWYAIDQYVMNGGKLLLLLDSLSSVAIRGSGLVQPRDLTPFASQVDLLNGRWGFRLNTQFLVADPGNLVDRITGEQPAFLLLQQDAFSNEVVVSGLNSLLLPYAGVLEIVDNFSLKSRILIQSSPFSIRMPVNMVYQKREHFDALYITAEKKSYPLALLIQGSFSSLFPNGPPESVPDLPWKEYRDRSSPSQIIVIADCDFIEDRIWSRRSLNRYTNREEIQVTHDNSAFIQNAVDFLTGDNNLIQIRCRREVQGFSRVIHLWREADRKVRIQVQRLREEETKIREQLQKLESQKRSSMPPWLSLEEQKERDRLRRRYQMIRQEIRDLMRQRNREVDALGIKIVWINLLTMPLLILLFWIGVSMYRYLQERW